MVTILSEVEGVPAAWPAVTGHFPQRDAEAVDEDTPSVDAGVTWGRLESWIAHRWGARSVVWIMRGPGEWTPRLQPFTLATLERWDGAAWVAETPVASPLGYVLDDGRYRATGTAGDASAPPEPVLEAWRRLHEYQLGIARAWWAEAAAFASDGGSTRPASWAAKAIQLSGAADLLRPWRGLGR